MHPRVVRAKIAPPDQHEFREVLGRLQGFREPRHVLANRLGHELDHAARGLQHAGQRWLKRSEIDAVGAVAQSRERQAVRNRPERVAVGARPDHDLDEAIEWIGRFERRGDVTRRLARHPRIVGDGGGDQMLFRLLVDDARVRAGSLATGNEREAHQYLRLARPGRLEQGRGPLHTISHGEP